MNSSEAMIIIKSASEEATYGTHEYPSSEDLSDVVSHVQKNFICGLESTLSGSYKEELDQADEALAVLGFGPVHRG